MSTVAQHPSHAFARRLPPHRIIIARGDNVRTITVRPWLLGLLGVAGGLFALLYLAATGYLVLRDDLLAASIARQARMQHAYEDRIASLRADIDRLTSRQLLNQEAVEAEMDKLLGRQAALDMRQDIIAGLSQAMRRAGLAPAEAVPLPRAAPAAVPAETAATPAGSLTTSSLGLSSPPATSARIDQMETSLERLARDQIAFVDDVAATVSMRADRIAAVLKGIGRTPPASHVANADGVGGPFVGLAEDADPDTFRSGVALVTGEIDRFAAIRRLANALPLTTPIPNPTITSRFGMRMDPFLNQPAMHTGVDFRAAAGTPVHATAAGTVVKAEYLGGYGNLVEIDHGKGITTRFAHLGKIVVSVGQVVAKGTVIGEAGSTGRSTGPHAHYELRVDGAAIDPMTYVAAGNKVAPLL